LTSLPYSPYLRLVSGHLTGDGAIELNFDRVIEPHLLSLSVFESVNGLTIQQSRDDSAPFIPTLDNADPVQVIRNRELVPGSLNVLDGNSSAVFQANRLFAYGAQVFINVDYDGQALERSTFSIEPIRAFVQGQVMDQLTNPISGLSVRLENADGLALDAETDSNGSFAFGFDLPLGQGLRAGQYTLIYNPSGASPDYARFQKRLSLQEGTLNREGSAIVARLNSDVAYRVLSSGQAEVSLAGGDLVLDFSAAQLLFPDGRDEGAVHVQLLPASTVNYESPASINPPWVLSFQPPGVEVSGEVNVRLKLPQLNGSYSYLPSTSFYGVMVALDARSQTLQPVGIGFAENYIVSAKLTDLNQLEYLSFTLVDAEQQVLKDIAEGKRSLVSLISELEGSL